MSQFTVLHFSLIAGVLVTAMLIGHLLRQRRSPAATLGWIIFMVSAPWLAVPLYLTLGTRKLAATSLPTSHPLLAETDTPLAGSANADLRSLFLNFELDCLFLSPSDGKALALWFTRLDTLTIAYHPPPDRWGRGLIEGLVLLAAFRI